LHGTDPAPRNPGKPTRAISVIGRNPVAGESTVQAAARELQVTRQKLISVLYREVVKRTGSRVVDIADRGEVAISLLRLGPPTAGQREVAEREIHSAGRKVA